MLLATSYGQNLLSGGGGSSGSSASSTANSSSKKSVSSCNSAIAAAVNATNKFQGPILNKLKSCVGDSLKSFSDSGVLGSSSSSSSSSSKLIKTNGSVNSSATITTFLAVSKSSSSSLPTPMKTLAARCRNSGQESMLGNSKIISKPSFLNDNQKSHSTNAIHASIDNTTTNSALSSITISSKTGCSVITLTNTNSNNLSQKTNTSSSPPTTSSSVASASASFLSRPIKKIPSFLFLKQFAIPPTALHRSSAERRRAASVNSLQEDMCHFKPIQTAPITPLKSSSKSRGVTLRHPLAIKKPNASSSRTQSNNGSRNLDVVDSKCLGLKIKPSIRLSHHARYSAFVSLRVSTVFIDDNDKCHENKSRKRKAPNKTSVERCKRPKKQSVKKRGKTKTTTKTRKQSKVTDNKNNVVLKAEIDANKRTLQKKKSSAKSEESSSIVVSDRKAATNLGRGSKKKLSVQRRASKNINNNNNDSKNDNNRQKTKRRTTKSSNTTTSTATTSSVSKRTTDTSSGRKTPPLTRSRVKRMPHLQLI